MRTAPPAVFPSQAQPWKGRVGALFLKRQSGERPSSMQVFLHAPCGVFPPQTLTPFPSSCSHPVFRWTPVGIEATENCYLFVFIWLSWPRSVENVDRNCWNSFPPGSLCTRDSRPVSSKLLLRVEFPQKMDDMKSTYRDGVQMNPVHILGCYV